MDSLTKAFARKYGKWTRSPKRSLLKNCKKALSCWVGFSRGLWISRKRTFVNIQEESETGDFFHVTPVKQRMLRHCQSLWLFINFFNSAIFSSSEFPLRYRIHYLIYNSFDAGKSNRQAQKKKKSKAKKIK